jgi:hypothetical protein
VPLELGHYALHAWDLGLGDRDAKLDERAAGILVPQYIFNLWEFMFDPEVAKDVHIRYGIRIDGDRGGQWIVAVSGGQWAIEEADDLRDAQAVIRYRHPSDMVLNSYFRIEAGEVSGEPDVIHTGRDALLAALCAEEDRLVGVVSDPDNWRSDTQIDGWTVQDVVCHLIDDAENNLKRWDMARRGVLPERPSCRRTYPALARSRRRTADQAAAESPS